MERIKLSKDEKKVLLWVSNHPYDLRPKTFPQHLFNVACYNLESKNLVRTCRIEGGDVEAVRLTPLGKGYILDNPTLKNPINWDRVLLIISIIISIIGLFTGCVSLLKVDR